MPGSGRNLLPKLDASHRIPLPSELDGTPSFAEIRAAWNMKGLGFQISVNAASYEPFRDQDAPEKSDGLQLWIDTRNTQTIHRASRFCHHFVALPPGRKKSQTATVQQLAIARSREDVTLADPNQFGIQCDRKSDTLNMSVWIPAECMTGYDPELNPKLGFHAYYSDRKLGEQFLTLDNDFPFSNDPSLWSTLELVDKKKA